MIAAASLGLLISQAAPVGAESLSDTLSGVSDSLGASASLSDSLTAVGEATSTAAAGEAGGALEKILASLPTEPASVFALLLLVGCTVLVLRYGLKKGDTAQTTSAPSESSTFGDSSKR
jgi:hypothetical protein